VLSASGEHEAALAAYDAVLARTPQHRAALLERASVLRAMGRTAEAKAELEKLLAMLPGDAAVEINLASLLLERREHARARELLVSASADGKASDAVRALAHWNLGLLHGREGEHGAAVAAFEEALRLDPALDEARIQIGNALGRAGDYSGAASRYAEVLERAPANVAARLAHATALALGGRADEARDSLLAGLRATPDEPNVTHALARLLAASPDRSVRDGQRALELALAVFEQAKTMEHAETVAMAYAEMGAFEDATRWQRTLLAEAERLAEPGWTERLRANLERYERRQAP
jgi:tetratricopeptide (TPR) repeat protein